MIFFYKSEYFKCYKFKVYGMFKCAKLIQFCENKLNKYNDASKNKFF